MHPKIAKKLIFASVFYMLPVALTVFLKVFFAPAYEALGNKSLQGGFSSLDLRLFNCREGFMFSSIWQEIALSKSIPS